MMVPVFIANGGFLYAFVGVLFVLAFAWGVLMLLGSGVESLFSRKAREVRKIEREGRRLARKARKRTRETEEYYRACISTPVGKPAESSRPDGRHFAD